MNHETTRIAYICTKSFVIQLTLQNIFNENVKNLSPLIFQLVNYQKKNNTCVGLIFVMI